MRNKLLEMKNFQKFQKLSKAKFHLCEHPSISRPIRNRN